MTSLIFTKLHQPGSRKKLVQRLPLIQRLTTGLNTGHRVFLISAPPGFGKTTCVSEWVNSLKNWPTTWLSLDCEDDDPGRFFSYLIAALQKISLDLGREIRGVLQSGQLPSGEILSTILINDASELRESFLLVLDDFHVIQDQFILEVFRRLIAHLPQQLRLVIITREDPPIPLAQLRASNLLTEIRAMDLRFDKTDIDLFLKDVMGISLDQTDIDRLEAKTEGWIVGLQLAGLSMKDQEDKSVFIHQLSGNHRYIMNYLTEQVLGQQSTEVQRFLLQTSILDNLNGDLCNSVTGRSDSHILLEKILTSNLFIVPLDAEKKWYRYHQLFADLLSSFRSSLLDEKTTVLHKRASQWYAKAGMASEAIQHALLAEDFAMTVKLLESYATDFVMQGYAKTVNGWFKAMPAKWQTKSPKTNMAFAWMYLLRGAYSQAYSYLEKLGTILIESETDSQVKGTDPALVAEWLVMKSLVLYMLGNTTECLKSITNALEITPEQDRRVRSMAYYVLASLFQLSEDYQKAVENYRLSIQYGRMSNNYVAEMMSTIGLAAMLHEQGLLRQAFEIASQTVERIEQSEKLIPISAVVYSALGDVYYQWYEIGEARRHIMHALHLSLLGGANTVTIFCHTMLSRLDQLEGDLNSATSEIQKAVDLMPVGAPDYMLQEIASQQVRLYIASNRCVEAEMTLQEYGFFFDGRYSFPDLLSGKGNPHSVSLLYNSSLRLLVSRYQPGNGVADIEDGLELTNRLIPLAYQHKQILIALESLLLRAQMHALIGENYASQQDYIRALELAEPEGIVGIFLEFGHPVASAIGEFSRLGLLRNINLEYVRRILHAFSDLDRRFQSSTGIMPSESINLPALINPLSVRELEVLRNMIEGLKYKEIAENLYISQNTVRFHVKSIYSKLNVNNRTQAIEKARQLQIL